MDQVNFIIIITMLTMTMTMAMTKTMTMTKNMTMIILMMMTTSLMTKTMLQITMKLELIYTTVDWPFKNASMNASLFQLGINAFASDKRESFHFGPNYFCFQTLICSRVITFGLEE